MSIYILRVWHLVKYYRLRVCVCARAERGVDSLCISSTAKVYAVPSAADIGVVTVDGVADKHAAGRRPLI
jgi:hypothetical protein